MTTAAQATAAHVGAASVDATQDGAAEPARPDLRLAIPAGCAWVTAALLLSASPRVSLAVGMLCAVGAVLGRFACLPTAYRPGRPRPGIRRPGVRHRSLRRLVAGCMVCAAAAATAVGLRIAAVESSPLHELAAQSAAADVRLVVLSDPALVQGHTVGPRRSEDLALVRARAVQVTARGHSTRLAVPVLVLASGSRWRELLPSQRVTASGLLSPTRSGELTAAVLRVRGDPHDVTAPSLVQRTAGQLRRGLREAAAPLPDNVGGLLPGLVVGDVSRLTSQVRDDFRATGMTHLTAVSGSNVAVIIAAALLVARLLGAGPRLRAVTALAAIAGFAVLARPDPSVLRASVMGAIAVLAVASGRARAAAPALAAAVLLLVLADPDLARAPGFALSVLATAGLLFLAPPIRDRFARRLPLAWAEALAIPVAAQVACAPVIAAISSQVSLVAVPANLLAAPAVAPATVLGVLAALVAPVWMSGAQALAWLAAWPCRWLVAVAGVGAGLPGGGFGWPGGTTGGLLLVGATVAALLAGRSRRLRRIAIAAAAAMLTASALVHTVAPGWPPPGWVMVACDVGQGDALVLAAGPGAAVVVDAGPDPDAVDGCLRGLGITQVPLLVLSHLHADHAEGVPGVLRHRRVAEVETNALEEPTSELARLRGWLTPAGIPLTVGGVGEHRSVGPLSWDLLAPAAPFHGTNSDPNNSSLVLRVQTRGITLLLTGDVEPPAQDALLESGVDVTADVLKIPHHGSDHQSPEFLDAVHARVAIASVGAGNTYGHPSPDTLSRLQDDGARTMRTDTDGSVAVTVDGGGLQVVGSAGSGTPPDAPPQALSMPASLCPRGTMPGCLPRSWSR